MKTIKERGGTAVGVLADLADPSRAEQLADEATDALSGVDILINNAGDYANRSWQDARPEDWEQLYRANVVSAVALIRKLVPSMRAGGWAASSRSQAARPPTRSR